MASLTRAGAAALAAAAPLLLLAAPSEPPADLLLTGARVWTGEAASPWAQAVAVRGERIVYVGDAQGARPWRGPKTKVLDFPGRLVVPGFNDAHV
ncbi:MAG TPA: amidohydrolase, partial [Vicinamibacteria bacterium]